MDPVGSERGSGSEASEDDDRRLDRLRRQLYRRSASEEDRRRYEHLRAHLRAALPTPPPREAARHRSRTLVPIAAAGGLLVIAAAATLLPISGPSAVRPTASVGAVIAARPHPDPSTATPAALALEGVVHRARRFHGVGPAVVPLLGAGAPANGGRLVVALTSDEDAPLGWTAARWASRGDEPSTVEVVARSDRRQRRAGGAPESVVYAGDPPVDIAVSDPGSHRWTLTVAFLDPPGDAAR